MKKYILFIAYVSVVGESTCYYHDDNVAHIMRMPKMETPLKVIQLLATNDKAALRQASEILSKTDIGDALIATLFKNDYHDDARGWICELFLTESKKNPRWIKKFREKKQLTPLGGLFSEIQ